MLDQEHQYFAEHAENFAVGDHLVVAPVMQPNATHLPLRLPRGRWYDYWTDTVYDGQQDINRTVDLATMPIFVRAGAVIPSQPLMQYTHEKPVDQLTLDVYFGEAETTSHLYEDTGEGYDYQEGQSRLKHFKVKGSAKHCRITQHLQGSYAPDYAICQIRIHGLPFSVRDVQVDRKVLSFQQEGDVLTFSAVEDFGEINIQ
jgi:alpha-glucosidase